MEEKTYQTPCGTIHYWTNVSHSDEITLVFLPGLTADHRLFDKQIQYFENRYNVIVWDAPHTLPHGRFGLILICSTSSEVLRMT